MKRVIPRKTLTLAAGMVVGQACLLGTTALGASRFWDTTTAAGLAGGAGAWATSGAANWNDSVGTAGANTNWANGTDIANFSGTSGAIAVNETIQLSRLNLTAGYSFAGTGALDFGSSTGVIDTTSNIANFSIGLAGTNGVTKSGAAIFTFTGTGTYTGALTVSGGVFTLGNATAITNRLASSSSLTVGSATAAGTFTMAAATGATTSQALTNLSVGIGANTLNSSGASAGNIANLSFSGNYSRSSSGVLNLTNTTGFNVTANFANHNDGTNIIDGVLVGVSRSNNTFVANNNAANGAPTSTNNVWSSGTHTVATSNNGVAYTGTTASLRLSGTRIVTLGSGAVINTGMIANNGGAAPGTVTGGTLTSGNGKDLILLGGDSAYRLEVASQIVNNGATPIGLIVANAIGTNGNLISGNNTYTGDTVLASSFTIAGNDNAFGGGDIIFAGGSLGASIGSNRVLANDISMTLAGNLNGLNQTAASPFGGAGTTYNLALSGNISGPGNLTLNNGIGANTVTLSGNNTGHTGTVIINQATTTLALGSDNAIGTSVGFPVAGTVTSSNASARSFTVSNYPAAGAIFGQAGTGDLNVTMPTLGSSAYNVNVGNALTKWVNPTMATGAGATLTKNGAGTLAFTGDFSLFGSAVTTGLTINAGAVQLGTGGTTGSLTITGAVANVNGTGGKLIFNRSNALAWSTAVTGAVGLEQKGLGTTTVSGTHSYSGATQVTAGGLLVNGSLTNTSGVSVASAAFLGGNGTIGGAVTVDGSVRPGNSIDTLNVTNDVTWNGGVDWVFELAVPSVSLAAADAAGSSSNDRLNLGGAGNDFLKGTGSTFRFDFAGYSGADGWFKLVDWTSLTTFASADFTAANAGGKSALFVVDNATSALYVYLSPVPEPSGVALLGVAGLVVWRRRRRA